MTSEMKALGGYPNHHLQGRGL